MKRTFLVFFIAVLVLFGRVGAQAQEHFMYKGIEMSCSVKEFATKLKRQGFSLLNDDGNVVSLSGTFNGKKCNVYLNGTCKTNSVWYICTYIESYHWNWDLTMANYEDLKRAFIKKYGEPVVCNEHLSDNAAGREYASLIDDESKIETIWQLEKGAIILSVTGYKADPLQLSGCVEILHIDLKNRSLANEEELSDL